MPRVRLQGYASRTTTGWIVLGVFDGMLGMICPGFKRLDTMSSGRAKGIFDGLPIPADKAVCYFLLIFDFCPCSSANGHFLLSNNNEPHEVMILNFNDV